jgi:hypothetical protein
MRGALCPDLDEGLGGGARENKYLRVSVNII